MKPKIIFHIDLNSFFASAEVARKPELRGKPVVVAGKSKRSIITTANYEARAFGIHSAMPLFIALEKCPHLQICKPDIEYYREISNQFFDILRTYTNHIEITSIDECYMDTSEICDETTYELLAINMMETVFSQLDLTISIGIAPNKFLAKMASDMKKPNGYTILTRNRIETMLWPLPIGKMHGIGKKTAPKLIDVGILTIKDLAFAKNNEQVKNILKKHHFTYVARANGFSTNYVNPEKNQLQSIGHSTTLQSNTNDETILIDYLYQLSMKVVKRAKAKHLLGKQIGITLKDAKFKTITRSVTLDYYTNDLEVIYQQAVLLFQMHYDANDIRLIGVTLNLLINQNEYVKQLSLFSYQQDNEQTQLNRTILELKNKFGADKISIGTKVKNNE